MQIPQLKFCCCSCRLRDGTLIIGWLSLMLSTLALITSTILLIIASYKKSDNESTNESFITGPIPITSLICSVMFIGLAAMLLMGVFTFKPKLVLSWVITVLVTGVSGYTITTVLMLIYHTYAWLIISTLLFILGLYTLLVVYSYYREMRSIRRTYPVKY